MKSIFKTILFQAGLTIFLIANAQAQCNQNSAPDLGNDTILCPGNTLQLDLSGLTNNPILTWDNGTNAVTRTISAAGTYFVEARYLSTNLVVNGDFQLGNNNFLTDYIVGTGGAYGLLSNPGTYAISTSPNLVHNNFSFCGDHTTGTGNMMIVNGANVPGTDVWCQTVNVTPNTDYEFSTWASNALNDPNIAQLQFTINGVNLGTPFSTATVGCSWTQFFEIWNSGTNTTAQICITNLNSSGGGNDFMIDDISFAPVCIFNDTIVVDYNATPVFTLPTVLDDCQGATLTLDAENSGFDFNWSTGDNTQTIQVSTSGIYTATVSDNGYCEEDQDFIVTFHQGPNAGPDQTFDFCNTDLNIDLYSLLGPTIDALGLWYDGNGLEVVAGQLDVSLMNGVSDFDYVLNSTYCPSDTAVFSLDIKVFKSAGNDINEHFCNTGTTDLNNFVTVNNPGVWTSLDGLTNAVFDPTSGILTMDNLAKNIYTFQYVVSNDSPCDNDTTFAFIEISEEANVDFSPSVFEGCSPLIVDFTDLTVVNGTKQFKWYVDGVQVGINQNLTYVFDEVKCYDIALSIETDNFCTGSLTKSNLICVNPDPIADFEYKPTTVYSDNPIVTFKNKSQLNAYNQWKFDDLGGSTTANPVFTFPFGKEDDYEVTLIVTSDKGCIDSITKVVPVRDQTIFYVPNAFTPDGDDNNNVFLPIMTVGVDPQNYKLEIFNRWGELIFESNDYNVGWDGTYGGKMVKSGTYVWKIRFNELKTEDDIIQMGTVTLMR